MIDAENSSDKVSIFLEDVAKVIEVDVTSIAVPKGMVGGSPG